MMSDVAQAAQEEAWLEACERVVQLSTVAMHRRMPHWVAIGARVWADPLLATNLPGHRRSEELVRVACLEIREREAYIQRLLLTLVAQRDGVAMTRVLADATRLAGELLRDGCRDVERDLDRVSRFERGVDVDQVVAELSDAVGRVTSSILLAVSAPE